MSSRLWRGCVVFAFLTVGAGTLIYSGVRYQNAAISNEVNNIHPLEITTLEIRADFADCQAAMGAYVLTRQPQVLVFYRQARGAVRTALDQVAGRSKAQLRPNVTAQQRALATWLAFGVRIQALPAGDPALVTVSAESFPSAFAFDAANNRMLAQLQAEDKIALSNAKHVLASAVAWSGTLALLAVLLAVLAAFGTIRAITRPLRGLTSTLHRLSGGDHTARADLAGSLEARDVAQAVNTMADETDRLRTAQEERSRLRTMAREAGFRIREHLHADDVIRAARAVLEDRLLGFDLIRPKLRCSLRMRADGIERGATTRPCRNGRRRFFKFHCALVRGRPAAPRRGERSGSRRFAHLQEPEIIVVLSETVAATPRLRRRFFAAARAGRACSTRSKLPPPRCVHRA